MMDGGCDSNSTATSLEVTVCGGGDRNVEPPFLEAAASTETGAAPANKI